MPRNEERHPFRGVTDLFSELNRMRDVGTHGREHPHEDKERTHASAWVPPTDIVAQGQDLLIRVELAGVDPEDVHLSYSSGILTVSGNRRSGLDDDDPSRFYVRERFYGEFRRSITLPESIQPSQITAEFDNGLVQIVVRGYTREAAGTRIELADKSSAATTRRLSS
ncbi:MAG TPA: Hsp20/alpha crystallin family protein [Nocardioidaceae bacterium]|jgi:HSP20 family protein|nr:Hsp20/alpha crystallin family protein [Nocardioidaceae bacterium]